MLQNSNHPVIQSKLPAIRRDPTNPDQSLTSATRPAQTHANPLIDNLKSTAESSLWSIAQHRLHKNNGPINSALFFASNHQAKQLPTQTDDDIILLESSDREFDCDNTMLANSDANLPPNLNCPTAFDELRSDGSSMLTFQDEFETTQTSIDNFSQTPQCLPDIWDDVEILLSDEILMDEVLGEHELFEDMDLF